MNLTRSSKAQCLKGSRGFKLQFLWAVSDPSTHPSLIIHLPRNRPFICPFIPAAAHSAYLRALRLGPETGLRQTLALVFYSPALCEDGVSPQGHRREWQPQAGHTGLSLKNYLTVSPGMVTPPISPGRCASEVAIVDAKALCDWRSSGPCATQL